MLAIGSDNLCCSLVKQWTNTDDLPTLASLQRREVVDQSTSTVSPIPVPARFRSQLDEYRSA